MVRAADDSLNVGSARRWRCAVRLPMALWLLLPLALGVTTPSWAASKDAKMAEGLSRAEALLDSAQPEEALEILDALLAKGKPNAQALLLRSTGRIMLADLQGGIDDLQRAIKVDPKLRQAWLNLAGIEIAQRRFESGYKALLKAQALDPKAPDNGLNLGAALLMLGRRGEAAEHFESYLSTDRSSAEAYYLVASNYALAGLADPAVKHLAEAILRDERWRLRARSDDRFLTLDDAAYRRLMITDTYLPGADAHTAAAAFGVAYGTENHELLYAVLEALRSLQISYDPQIETTPEWALVWADLRVKVSNQPNGTGVVRLSAPAARYTTDSWKRVSERLFQAIHHALAG